MPRFVLTGAPGAGKTAVLRMLELDGWPVVEEAATDVIAVEQALGEPEPWRHPAFVDKVVDLQRRRHASVPPEAGAVFFDRSPVCTLALSRYLGFPTSRRLAEEIERIGAGGYARTVFLVRNQGSVRRTAARRITFEESLAFERLHETTYRQLGFTVVDVPAGPLPDRVQLVQQTARRLTTCTAGDGGAAERP